MAWPTLTLTRLSSLQTILETSLHLFAMSSITEWSTLSTLMFENFLNATHINTAYILCHTVKSMLHPPHTIPAKNVGKTCIWFMTTLHHARHPHPVKPVEVLVDMDFLYNFSLISNHFFFCRGDSL